MIRLLLAVTLALGLPVSGVKAASTVTVTTDAGVGGTITPSGTVALATGTTQAFAITADPGYAISGVSVDGKSFGAISLFTFTQISASHTITAAFKSTQHVITASAGAGGTISPSGQVPVALGADQAFSFTPDPGYSIDSVTVDGQPMGTAAAFTFAKVTTDHTIAASFKPGQHIVTASAGAGGSISPGGQVPVAMGANQAFTCTPNPGYAIAAITVDGKPMGTAPVFTFSKVTLDHTIAVAFTSVQHLVSASAGPGGTITPAGQVPVAMGANQAFTCTPDPGYVITAVTVDGKAMGTAPVFTFSKVTSDHTIAVAFKSTQHFVTASAGAGGSISPSGQVPVALGANQLFTFTPDPGFAVDTITVDSQVFAASPTFTLSRVSTNRTIAVAFKSTQHFVTASAGAGGSISPSGQVPVALGADQVFTFTPDPGFAVISVTVDGQLLGATSRFTLTRVSSNHTISVAFGSDQHFVTTTAGIGGTITPGGVVPVLLGADQAFTFTPDPGYAIDSVTADGVRVRASSLHTFVKVAEDHTLVVAFKPQYTITVSAGPGGTISPNKLLTLDRGATQVFAIKPFAGYAIDAVTVDGKNYGPHTTFTMAKLTANHSISVTFRLVPNPQYVLTAWAGPGGAISPSASQTVPPGANFSYTITPDPGFTIASVFVDGINRGTPTQWAFTNIQDPHAIRATFTGVAPTQADVVVYGGTPSGITAAIQAARLHKQVVLLEPSQHIGGMCANGLGLTDRIQDKALGGLVIEFFNQIHQFYPGYTEDHSGRYFAPHIAEEAFLEMLGGYANLAVVFNESLASVARDGTSLVSLTTAGGATYSAKMFIDSSYEGDLLAKAGITYATGRESSSQYGESLAGVQKPLIPGSLKVDPYLQPGNPSSGLLPHIEATPVAAKGSADPALMAFSYRLCLSIDPTNQLPIQPPANYDPQEFELLGRQAAALIATGRVVNLLDYVYPMQLPDNKIDLNSAGSFLSTNLVGGGNGYLEASPDQRRLIVAEHERYTRGVLTFLQTDPRIASVVSDTVKGWGLCQDEFVDNGGWPRMLYVREGRRMIGDYVMTEQDLMGTTGIFDSIGLGGYAVDIHTEHCCVTAGSAGIEGTMSKALTAVYPIPFRILTPQRVQASNLLATVAVSASHVAYSSLRIEETCMTMGQTAGAAASLAIDQGQAVQDLPYPALADLLRLQGMVLLAP